MKPYLDKHGMEIKAGDRLHNQHDAFDSYEVLEGPDGELYLGDLGSPLEIYRPDIWWEIAQ